MTTRITLLSSTECIGDSLNTYNENFQFLDGTTCNLSWSANNLWGPALTTTANNSGSWNSVYSTVNDLSGRWESATTSVATLSASFAPLLTIIYPCPTESVTESNKVDVQTYINNTFPVGDFNEGTVMEVFFPNYSITPDRTGDTNSAAVCEYDVCFIAGSLIDDDHDTYIKNMPRFKFQIVSSLWAFQSYSTG